MWIAKPLRSLSQGEQAQWDEVLAKARQSGREAPLAQTRAWGRAIEAVAGKAYVAFSPEERVGGLLFSSNPGAPEGMVLESVNGPMLDWGDSEKIKGQLAMFATAAFRLEPRIGRITLRPRWLQGEGDRWLASLPILAGARSFAATLKLSLKTVDPEAPFSARLKRTLRHADRAGISARWEELDPSKLVEFAVTAQAFGRARGFAVPPVFWFRALTDPSPATGEAPRFGLVTAQDPQGHAGCQLLIAHHSGEAHYLFGHEWRTPQAPASMSPAAAAHRLAIREAVRAGLESYDFNGYLEDAAPDHPYSGVSSFKAQFGAEIVRYEVPEFTIEP